MPSSDRRPKTAGHPAECVGDRTDRGAGALGGSRVDPSCVFLSIPEAADDARNRNRQTSNGPDRLNREHPPTRDDDRDAAGRAASDIHDEDPCEAELDARSTLPASYFEGLPIRQDSRRDGPPRLVTYCRYSRDGENIPSIERQIRAAEQYMERIGAMPASGRHNYIDESRSGATMERRAALHELLERVRSGGVEGIFVQAIDRLGRDLVDLTEIQRETSFRKIDIHTENGVVDLAELILRGLVAQEERKAIAIRMETGRRDAAEAGRFLGSSPPYGYVAVDGGVAIDPDAAAIVRDIFQQFAFGVPINAIVRKLNLARVPSATGKSWKMQTLLTGPTGGLLQRSLYRGIFKWGRTEKIRPPGSAVGRALPADPSRIVEIAVPELALVDARTIELVDARIAAMKAERQPRPYRQGSYLLSGILRCGCGAAMSYASLPGGMTLVCLGDRDGLDVHPHRRISACEIENRVLVLLRDSVLEESVLDAAEKSRLASVENVRRRVDRRRRDLLGKIARLETDLRASLEASAGVPLQSRAVVGMRRAMSVQLRESKDALNVLDVPAVISPRDGRTEKALRQRIGELVRRSLRRAGDIGDEAARSMIRSIVSEITVYPKGRGDYDLHLNLRGNGAPIPIAPEACRIGGNFRSAGEGFVRDAETVALIASAASEGVFALDDDAWEAVADLFADPPRGPRRPTDAAPPRRIADASIFIASTGVPIRHAPPWFGSRVFLEVRLKNLGKVGAWRRAVLRLRRHGWPGAAELDPSHFPLRAPKRGARGQAVANCIAAIETARSRKAG